MPNVQQTMFPVVSDVMDLVRSIVNDTFPGIAGTQGRIFTNDAPFTLPYMNSAIRTILRKLRNEGVTFPIVDGYVLAALAPVVQADPSVFVNVSYNGYNNGTTSFPTPYLPGNLTQIYTVRQRVTGSGLQFQPMRQAQEGLPSAIQNQWIGPWEVRGYALWMNGSLQEQDLMIRYQTGQPPINAPVDSFDTTQINIIDCQEAVANFMAAKYGRARGGNKDGIASCMSDFDEAVDDMALEYIRRGQTVNYRRNSYQGGGSNDDQATSAGSSGVAE